MVHLHKVFRGSCFYNSGFSLFLLNNPVSGYVSIPVWLFFSLFDETIKSLFILAVFYYSFFYKRCSFRQFYLNQKRKEYEKDLFINSGICHSPVHCSFCTGRNK